MNFDPHSSSVTGNTDSEMVIGAAAGGIIMYAMTKSVEQSNKQPEPQRITTYRTIEAPPAQNYAPPSRAPEFNANSKGGHVVNGRSSSRAIPIEAPSCSHSETVISRSEYSCHSQNGENEVVVLSKGSRISAAEARHSHVSHAPSSQKTIRQADLVPLPPSAPVTKVRSARNVPLPYSVATSRASRDKDIGREARMEDSRSTVVTPHDSISQVSTKPSKASGRAKHHREEDEHRSSKGSKAGSKKGSSSRVSRFKVMGGRSSIPGF